MRRPSLALLLVLTVGCGAGQSGEPDITDWTMTGTWRGGFRDGVYQMSAVLEITEDDTLIGGTGYISGSGLECAVELQGTLTNERLRMDMTCPGYLPIRYRGNREGSTRISGYVLGSGLPQSDMDLIKQ